MHNESDEKNKKISVTMTNGDFEIIKQKAKEAGMGVSTFMVGVYFKCRYQLLWKVHRK